MEERSMKHINPLILAAFTLAALSCSKEAQDAPEKVGGKGLVPMTVSATGADTKTYVDGTSIVWEDSDNLAIFDGTDKQVFSISNIAGKKADFSGVVTEGSTDFYAVYPADYASALNAGVLTATLPAAQVIPAGKNVAHGAMVSVGKVAADKSLGLKNVFSYLTVEVTRDDIQSIVLNGTNLAGEATFDAEGALKNVTSGVSTVTVTYAGGSFPTGKYYIPVLPGTTAAGAFSVSMTALNGENADWCAEKVATNAVTLKKNEGLAFGELDTKVDWYFNIHDAASLERFRTLVSAGTFPANGVAKMTSDIDLSGVTLAAAAGSFKGTLDGQGHTISNWTSNGVSLFDTVNGPSLVQGITFDASCSLTPKVQAERFGFLAQTIHNDAVVTNCHNYADISIKVAEGGTTSTYLGAFVGVSYGTISECTNHGDITFETVGSGAVYLGGIVGYINANGDSNKENALLNNKNYGNILFKNTGASAGTFIGGITAGTSTGSETADKGTIRGCVNEGSVEYYFTNGSTDMSNGTSGNGNYMNVGGIAGYMLGNVIGCINGSAEDATKGHVKITAPITASTQASTRPSAGGVAGYVSMNMTGCKNYGKMEIVQGTFGKGTAGNNGAGIVENVTFGGVAGQVGHRETASSYKFADNENYGIVSVTTKPTGANYHMVGGVVGYSVSPMSNCINNGEVTLTGANFYAYLGGVAGQIIASGNVSGLYNNGTVKLESLEGGQTGRSEIGGVAGIASTSNVIYSDIYNDADVINEAVSSDNLYIGGLFGRFGVNTLKKARNAAGHKVLCSGKTTSETETVFNALSGIIGVLQGTSDETSVLESEISNYAAVTSAAANESLNQYIGGIVGQVNNGLVSISGAVNEGKVTAFSSTAKQIRIGGIAGSVHQAMTLGTNTNKGQIEIGSDVQATNFYAGGILGYIQAGLTCNGNNTNTATGTITVSGKSTNTYIGGAIGYISSVGTANNLRNEAAITSSVSGTLAMLGGVIGFINNVKVTAENVSNSGNLTLNGSHSGDAAVGVILGKNNGANTASSVITAPTASANRVTITCNAAGNGSLYTGGAIGWQASGQMPMKSLNVNAKIDIRQHGTGNLYAGGIVGYAPSKVYDGNTIDCEITVPTISTKKGFIGGIAGKTNVGPTFTDCKLKALLTYDAEKYYAGIIAGSHNADSQTITIGTEAKPVSVVRGTSLNGVAVTGFTDDNVYGHDHTFTLTYTAGTTIKLVDE